MPADPLSYVGRRALAHLPVRVEDEAAALEANPERVSAFPIDVFTQKLLDDQGTPDMEQVQVEALLTELANGGCCEQNAEGEWCITQKGADLLVAVYEADDSQVAGPAFVEVFPASIDTNAEGA